MQVKIEGAQPYSFKDNESGRLVEGVNVFFLQKSQNADAVGMIPTKVTLPYSTWDKVKQLNFPSHCSLEMEQFFTQKGVKTKVVDLTLVK